MSYNNPPPMNYPSTHMNYQQYELKQQPPPPLPTQPQQQYQPYRPYQPYQPQQPGQPQPTHPPYQSQQPGQPQSPYPPEQFQYQPPPHPPPQQQHTQPPPPNGMQPNFDNGQGNLDFAEKFKVESPKFNDIWAAIAFIVTFLLFTGISIMSINGLRSAKSAANGGIYRTNTVSLNSNTLVLFGFVLLVAFVTSLIYLWVVRAFTKQAIWITGILQIVFGLGTALFYFSRHWWSAGIVFLLVTIFYIIAFITWIPRIPFSVLMLQTVIDVSKNFGHMFIVSLLGGLCATIFAAWFSITLVAVYAKYYPGGSQCAVNGQYCSKGKVIGILIFLTFAAFWITEVIKNVVHSSISGIYGSWYFFSQKPGRMPAGPTRGAFRRAMTYSFGSISFGSLIVALVQMLRTACSIAKQNEAAQGDILGTCFFCCLQGIIDILDWAIKFLNEYAFSYIALYGKKYTSAAKATWSLIKDRGIDVLVNECLINPVLTMGAVFVAYAASLLAFLFLQITRPSYNNGNAFTAVIMAYSFLIGLQIANIFLVPIKSGIATLFVAMAFDPQVLISEHHVLWQMMIQVYPEVQVAVHA